MAESGDWLVPRYQGEPFFDKPALAYWAMAAAFRLLGPEPAAARLVSVLAALGVVAATVSLGRRLFDPRTALAAGACLSTTLAFLSFGRIAMSDMLLCFFTTLGAALGASGVGRGPAALGPSPRSAPASASASSPRARSPWSSAAPPSSPWRSPTAAGRPSRADRSRPPCSPSP